jgi:hypothetical protein
MKRQKFKIGSVHGECCDVIGPDGARYLNVVLARYTDDGFTLINAVITKDSAGRVDVAWSHDDLTDGRINPYNDIEYDLPREGFWAAVQEHAAMMEAGDFPPECMD